MLILDDFGLTPLNNRGRADLLEVLGDRHGTGAKVVAGQMSVKERSCVGRRDPGPPDPQQPQAGAQGRIDA